MSADWLKKEKSKSAKRSHRLESQSEKERQAREKAISIAKSLSEPCYNVLSEFCSQDRDWSIDEIDTSSNDARTYEWENYKTYKLSYKYDKANNYFNAAIEYLRISLRPKVRIRTFNHGRGGRHDYKCSHNSFSESWLREKLIRIWRGY